MHTSCHLDGTLFPFDSQSCSVVVQSWAYSEAFVDLRNASNRIHLDGFNDDGSSQLTIRYDKVKGRGSPYSIAECRVPELIPVLGSQPAVDVSHKPGGRLPLLSARPAVTFSARRPVLFSLLGEQRHDGCEQFA